LQFPISRIPVSFCLRLLPECLKRKENDEKTSGNAFEEKSRSKVKINYPKTQRLEGTHTTATPLPKWASTENVLSSYYIHFVIITRAYLPRCVLFSLDIPPISLRSFFQKI
jgi:hypothetical protein